MIKQSKTLAELAHDALAVQNACNLSGVAHGFALAMSALCDHVRNTSERNTHPIAILWADKIAHLTGTQTVGNDAVMHAYTEVQTLANVKSCRQCGRYCPQGNAVTCGRSECQEAEYHDNKRRSEP